VLGDGDGRFTAQLLRTATHVRVTDVDGSAAMLEQLRRNCGGDADRVTTHHAVLPDGLHGVVAGKRYDLVATHFFLDCLTTDEVERLARDIRPRLTEDAVWVVSDFAVADGLFRLPSAVLVRSLYLSFRLLTGLRTQHLPRHDAALHACGFMRIERTAWLGGLLMAERWQLEQREHLEL
jgi:hypothetical protein